MSDQSGGDRVEGAMKRIVDAAWPSYGGNHQTAEFWEAFIEGVRFTLEQEAVPAGSQRTEANGWRPIETVPADGAPVLTYGGLSGFGGRPASFRVLVIDDRADLYSASGELLRISPTHWQPLPPAPAPTNPPSQEDRDV